jgi:hypothetical protein
MDDLRWGDTIRLTGALSADMVEGREAYARMMADMREYNYYSMFNPPARKPLPFFIKWKWRVINAIGALRGDDE